MKWLMIFVALASSINAAVSDSYDVIVFGSEPPAIAAAVGAARGNMRVLLITDEPIVGGLWTFARLNTLDTSKVEFAGQKYFVATGIFEEILAQNSLRERSSSVDDGFNVARMQTALNSLLADVRIIVRTYVTLKSVRKSDRAVTAVVYDYNGQEYVSSAKMFIDGSDLGILAFKLDVPYDLGREDITHEPIDRKEVMATTLIFGMRNVPWWLYGLASGLYRFPCGSTETSVCGFHHLGDVFTLKVAPKICPKVVNNQAYTFYLGGFNIGKQGEDEVAVNGLEIYGVNPENGNTVKAGLDYAKEVVNCIEKFFNLCFILFDQFNQQINQCKDDEARLKDYYRPPNNPQNLALFSRASVFPLGQKLYVREAKRFKSLYTVTNDDAIQDRQFYDNIALSSYPIDLRASKKFHPAFLPRDIPHVFARNPLNYYISARLLGDKNFVMQFIYKQISGDRLELKGKYFGIPLRSAIAQNIANLAFVGKIASFDSLALASARVMPASVTMGYSVGIAAAFSVNQKIDLHQLAYDAKKIVELQDVLDQLNGITIYPLFRLSKSDPDYNAFRYLLGHNVIDLADLHNDPNGPISRALFAKMMVKAVGLDKQAGKPIALSVPSVPTFDDVKPTDPVWSWAYPYVENAYKEGLVFAREINKFYPGAAVSREELAITLARYGKMPSASVDFLDVVRDYDFYSELSAVYAYSDSANCRCLVGDACSKERPIVGSVNGDVSTPAFAPYNQATFREVVRALYRAVKC